MFKKKSKKAKLEISFYDCNSVLLFSGEFNSIPIKETIIIKKSIEFFSDSEPCYIHRGAVIIRLIGEIENYFKTQPQNTLLIVAHQNEVFYYIDIDGIYGANVTSEVVVV